MNQQLLEDFEFYLSHQNEMVEKYDGKCIVIKDGVVIGVYDSDLSAVTETQKSHKLGTFLVQKVSQGDKDYSSSYSSRVSF